MPQPRSIRLQLALVFLLFFLLAGALGLFSMSRLSSFNQLSADVAEIWLPNTRTIGDLNNYTSDFRAIEGSNLLASDPAEIAATEKQMEELDRLIARAERSFERIRHDSDEARLYAQFTEGWNDYRRIVNQMLALSRSDRKTEALRMYRVDSRAAYNGASDTLGLLTDRIVATSRAASDRLAAAYRSAVWLISLAIVIAGVMVAAALAFISRTISAPLLNLANSMHRLAANNTDVHIPATERRDEIGEMARATLVFRNNAIELMRSQQALARQASGLEEQLAKEQRLALLQRNFVSMASHEFRTPLTIIDGHARRLMRMKDTMAAEEIGQRAGKIRSAVLRMTHLIDNLLNSSRLVDGGTRPHIEPIELDLNALLREVCQLHRETGLGVAIVERLDHAPLQMRGDPKLLFQAFSNLLSNAIKYSPGGDAIEVAADEEDGTVAIAIADHGIGIPAGDLDRLFERYHRGSNVSGIVGTGVGLYLVKMVVELHGGSIEVDSEEGKGSRFLVRLPLPVAGETEHAKSDHMVA
jgi:signal transduction histidine kinase